MASRILGRLTRPVTYVGCDIASNVVAYNQERHGRDGVRFMRIDVTRDPVPEGELVTVREVFQHLTLVVVDEWHELLGNKRGVQVQLALARLRGWNAGLLTWGMSATLGNLREAMHTLLGPGAPGTLVLRAIDTDAVSSSGHAEGSTLLRSGRLRVASGSGRETAGLQLGVRAEYWSGAAWVLNGNDSCTVVPATAVALGRYRNHLGSPTSAWTTSASAVNMASGSGLLSLTAPTPTASGSLALAINLGSTTADQSCTSGLAASSLRIIVCLPRCDVLGRTVSFVPLAPPRCGRPDPPVARPAASWVKARRCREREKVVCNRSVWRAAKPGMVRPLLIERAPDVTLATSQKAPAVSTTYASCGSATRKLLW